MKQSLRVVLFGLFLSLPLAAQATPNLDVVRAALAKYQNPVAALGDGYLSTLVCMQFPGSSEPGHMAMQGGGMGVHFLNAILIGPTVATTNPQFLTYVPVGDNFNLAPARGSRSLSAACWHTY